MNWRLNRAVGSILVLLFLVGVLPTTGSGATNQGLEWGVDVGNRFDYHVQDNNTGFDCYIIIESLPAILDGVSRIIHPTIFNVTPDMKLYSANGSVAGWWEWPLTQLIVPTGNWSLWSALLGIFIADHPFVYNSINTTETAISWTWIANSYYDYPTLRSLEEVATFRKSDGVLSYYQLTLFATEGDKDYEFIIRQTDFFTQTGPYLLLGGCIVALTAAVILYRKK